jgi:hypothetical protein
METFLGMIVEQEEKCIKIHLDNYFKEVIKAEDVPELPNPTKQRHYRSCMEKLHFAATWIRIVKSDYLI